jgi:hypothetical protein
VEHVGVMLIWVLGGEWLCGKGLHNFFTLRIYAAWERQVWKWIDNLLRRWARRWTDTEPMGLEDLLHLWHLPCFNECQCMNFTTLWNNWIYAHAGWITARASKTSEAPAFITTFPPDDTRRIRCHGIFSPHRTYPSRNHIQRLFWNLCPLVFSQRR